MCIQYSTSNSLVSELLFGRKQVPVQLDEKTALSYACECGICGSPFFHLQKGYIFQENIENFSFSSAL
jgi:hypothetical protein